MKSLCMARISVEELQRLRADGAAPVIVDLRSPLAQQAGRIPGAVVIPDHAIESFVHDVRAQGELIVYCACPNEVSAARVAKLLMQHGFHRVRPLAGGIDAWMAAGYDIEPVRPAASAGCARITGEREPAPVVDWGNAPTALSQRGNAMKVLVSVLLAIPVLVQAHDPKPLSGAPADAASNYVIRLEQMARIAAGEGETIHLLRGEAHGFNNLSFILTETAPGGGPPLHTHDSEEAHILTAGTMSYVIGDRSFVVSAPYILRVPAHTPHTFVNAGSVPLQLTAVFDSARYTFKPVAPNPLQKPARKP